jgi:N6-adenosine-specific RNA methylase IME4
MFAQGILEVRNSKLYRLEYDTFEAFCSVELGLTGNYAHKLIASAETVENIKLDNCTVLPTTESQARPLTKLEPTLQVEAWHEVVATIPQAEITAKKIEAIASEYKEANTFYKEAVKEAQAPSVFTTNAPMSEAEILAKAKEIRQAKSTEKKEERRADIQRQVEQIEAGELPTLTGLFHVVSVDPPWPYGREYDPETSRVANPYPEMSIEQIKAIELPLHENAVVFLWTTHAFLPDAIEIAKTWGLEYKATIVWNKEKMGMGAWLRMQCEFCLVCIKGKPFWDNTKHRDIINEPRREHSRKPDLFYALVSDACEGRKLEYFSREARKGWEIFGNDINKF